MISMKLAIILCCVYAVQSLKLFLPENKSELALKNLSPSCASQYEKLDFGTFFQMFDASTKIPNGIMAMSMFDLGNFDECYNIETTGADSEVIYGKYCLGTIPFPSMEGMNPMALNITRPKIKKFDIHPRLPQERLLGMGENSVGFHFAICVPHKCSADDAKELSIFSTFSEEFCYVKNQKAELSTGGIVTIVFLAFFLGLVLLSSAYDIYLYYMKKEAPHELLIAFSALSNGRKLFKSSSNPDQLVCLNGIKAISMMWVIIGHNYSNSIYGPLANMADVVKFQADVSSMWITSATLSVDTFFVVGGLVTVYTFLKSVDKGVKFNVPLYYIHRFLRLNPAFGVVILVYVNLLVHFGSGPLWNSVNSVLIDACADRWYASFFYFSNYYHAGCIGQSWYLSVDMQLFILSPLILIPLSKWKKLTLYFLGVLIILGMVIPFIIGYVYELNAFINKGDSIKNMMYYYTQTHCRFAPYVIGMLAGYYIYSYKKTGVKPKLNFATVCLLWLVAIGGLIACLWTPYDASQADYDRISHSFILALHRQTWSALIALVIILCVTGYGGPIDAFLSLPILQFLTKLSYSMYLTHYGIISVRYLLMKTPYYFSNYQLMMSFWGDFMFTIVISLVLCLTFESPIIILEKHIFGRGKPRQAVEKPKV